MFIKEITKKKKGYGKEFICHRLMESYRTERGPRQRTVLNLGKLNLPREQWKLLSDRIEDKISGQSSFLKIDEQIESLATHYANLLIQRRLTVTRPDPVRASESPDYETIDINSATLSKSRTIGAEYVGFSMFKKLGFEKLFKRLSFSQTQSNIAALSIVGRLVHPGSERRTRDWAVHLSGLDELLGTNFSHLSNKRFTVFLTYCFLIKMRSKNISG